MDVINVLGFAIGIIGLIYAFYSENKRKKEQIHRQQRFEWGHVQQGVKQICNWIKQDKFNPDFLLTVPGAGIILTELASIELGEGMPIYIVQQTPVQQSKTSHALSGLEIKTSKWHYFIPQDIFTHKKKDTKVLIIDDYAQSGDTLYEIKNTLVANGFKSENIKTASLITLKGLVESSKSPDYSWFFVDTYDVHMPWGHASKKVRTGRLKPL